MDWDSCCAFAGFTGVASQNNKRHFHIHFHFIVFSIKPSLSQTSTSEQTIYLLPMWFKVLCPFIGIVNRGSFIYYIVNLYIHIPFQCVDLQDNTPLFAELRLHQFQRGLHWESPCQLLSAIYLYLFFIKNKKKDVNVHLYFFYFCFMCVGRELPQSVFMSSKGCGDLESWKKPFL